MSEHDERPPQGSGAYRLGSTTGTTGTGDAGTVEAAAEARELRRRPVRHARREAEGLRQAELTPRGQSAYDAARNRPTDPHAVTPYPPTLDEEQPETFTDPYAEKRAERTVSLLFLLSAVGTIVFCVGYAVMSLNTSNYGQHLDFVLGTGLTLATLGLGAGFIVWAKKLVPNAHGVQERHKMHSPEEDELAAEEMLIGGADELGIGKRRMIRRSMLGALALFPVPFIFALRDLGPLPKNRLRQTSWKKDVRLVDLDTGEPIKLGDLAVGGVLTVMPEGARDVTIPQNAMSPVMLFRLAPGELTAKSGRLDWMAANHVAYSKICTHAGCPVSLYEQQTHHLLCPCHQSTFQLLEGCKVVFGPAARPLPMLGIYIDKDGYFRAKQGFTVPVGPSFWERGRP